MEIIIGLVGTVLVALAIHWFYPKYAEACFIAAAFAGGSWIVYSMLTLILHFPAQTWQLIANAPFMSWAFLPAYAIAALVGLPFRQLRGRKAKTAQHSVTVEVD
ncbi:MAG: hypothetical protein JO316_15555 [Abitibacteriaceae bacterium]|nr:hypothetical protein [Abditibacteriaceae bacterium]